MSISLSSLGARLVEVTACIVGLTALINAIEPLRTAVYEALDIKSLSWDARTANSLGNTSDFRAKCDYRFRLLGNENIYAVSGQAIAPGDTLYPDTVRAGALRLLIDDLRLEVKSNTKGHVDIVTRIDDPSRQIKKGAGNYDTALPIGRTATVNIALEERC
ncbi:MAG: hypothetical protein IT563_07350 [Alphaproteobacteria bacterium]|nr:hypothetical protein [Alphaproteobacteria bacterium]